jgi:hypothetical protein
MTYPQNKTELLTALATRRGEWMGLVAQVPTDQFDEPGVDGAWSMKDIIAHVAAYEWWTAIQLQAAAKGERAMVEIDEDLPSVPAHTDNDQDTRNAQIYAHNRHRAVPDVLTDADGGFAALMGAVATTPDALLADPAATDWNNGQPLLAAVAINSYGHYDDHIPAIRAWLAGRASDFEVI